MLRITLDVLFAAFCIAVFLFLAFTGLQKVWDAMFFSHGLAAFGIALAWIVAGGFALKVGNQLVFSHAFMR